MLYGDGIHDDTSAIQELLDKRGNVSIDFVGNFLISKTLIIHSNTRFTIAPGAKLFCAPMSHCSLIQNEHFAGGGIDENIEIVGGIWDGNCDNIGLDGEKFTLERNNIPWSPESFRGKLMRFCNVKSIKISGLTIKNPVSYGLQIGAVKGFIVRDIYFDYNHHFGTTDGVHINGPAYTGTIENIYGTTNDDLVSLTTYDEPHAECSLGDIEQVYIHNISADNGFSGIRLLSGENYSLRDIHIDGVYGTYRHNGIVISNHCRRPGKVWFDNIIIENVHCRKSHTPLGDGCFKYWENGTDYLPIIQIETEAICGRITIRNIIRHEFEGTNAPIIRATDTVKIDRLFLENIHQTVDNGTAPTIELDCEIGELIKRDVIE